MGPFNPDASAESPDIGFTLGLGETIAATPKARLDNDPMSVITAELTALLAPGWERLDVAIAMTVTDEAAQMVLSSGQQAALARPSTALLAALREHRQLSARSADGPWWRFLAAVTEGDGVQVEYDFGAEPFPGEHLFPAHAYRADLETYPRRRLPVWLAAYIGNEGVQVRTPADAFARSLTEADAGIHAVRDSGVLPALPVLWARWAVVSAAFVAMNSPWGPRVTTALGWFEGSGHSGCSLHRLPAGRAVLSGGIWNAPELDAFYNDQAPLPELYRGAPDWVAAPVLNPRADSGLLSFCYWWDSDEWRRGESPAAEALRAALPGIWSTADTVDVIAQLIGNADRAALETLVLAAEGGYVSRAHLLNALGRNVPDIGGGYYQLMLAGVVK
ncbi:hypothetical protein [Nocardia yamanashiensis]|uniref:hypothetical protein n=1 Tax=Nocardia yamanashiensis TaxID=209247 RepID=UPI0012FE3060|nr:hypothetical protein [Nocardia yamanashiensis]